MQTTCPECRTTFRVIQDQLGLRRGLVRCGHCNAVFNAYDTLLAELVEPRVAAPSADEPVESLPADLADDRTLPELTIPARAQELPARQPDTSTQVQPAGMDVGRDETARTTTEETPGDTSNNTPNDTSNEAPRETPDAILLSELPTRLPARPALPLGKRLSYGLAVVVLMGLLVLQLAYFLRAELVAALPQTRPALERLCAYSDCAVPLPRRLTNQAIVASNLEHDVEQKSRVRLTFLLANRTGRTQAWPSISLTLTDVRDVPVAQKLFPPETYLPKEAAGGMSAGSEREVRLELDIGNLAASGYALGLVYP
jgi:predicted Zn finger-like uncharacterized protein